MSDVREWRAEEGTGWVIGPCGCRVPNSVEGAHEARRHQHKATRTATPATRTHHTRMRVEREYRSRLSESNRRPIHYE